MPAGVVLFTFRLMLPDIPVVAHCFQEIAPQQVKMETGKPNELCSIYMPGTTGVW
jgi:hypothetical protein